MKKIYIALSLLLMYTSVFTQSPPKRELRGAWFTTYLKLDWPESTNTTVQKTDFTSRIQLLKQTGINAVYVQVRSECDAIYPSTLEPWSAVLSGTQGVPPSPVYDPLQYMIDETRMKGLEFHAWFNPFRAVSNYNNINNYAATHIAKLKPEWLLAQENLRILDPGIPAVREHVISVIMDVVKRYDIDGVHLDDYFYPYPPSVPANVFNDDATYNADPRGFPNTTAGRANWRRDNINIFIRSLNDSIKTIKPWVKFGISPFGIWRNQSSDANGSATNGLQSYSELYADSRSWIQNNWVDYLMPQLYWSIGFSAANYAVLAPWWNNNANNRHIYIGQAAYRVGTNTDANWLNPSQLNNQVRLHRTYNIIFGSCFFRTQFFITNPLSFRDSLTTYIYTKPALLPAMLWKDNTLPQSPTNLTASVGSTDVTLNWTKPSNTVTEMNKVRHFVVYRSTTFPVDTSNANHILHITPTYDVSSFTDQLLSPGIYYYTVTALDRLHNESAVSNTITVDLTATNVSSMEINQLNFRNYPNPFSNKTQISFELMKPTVILLTVYDATGKEMAVLANGYNYAGKQMISFDATKLKAGIYFATLKTKTFSKTIQLVVAK